MSDTLKHDDMPILDLDLSNTSRFEASRFLDNPETITAFLTEAMKANAAGETQSPKSGLLELPRSPHGPQSLNTSA